MDDSPYVREAQFYRAKALLRDGRAQEALDALRRSAAGDGAIAERARALADSVTALNGGPSDL
jgi:hypothetical protein